MNDRDALKAAVLIQDVYRAPVGERGHGQLGLFQKPRPQINLHLEDFCRFQHETEFVLARVEARGVIRISAFLSIIECFHA